MRGKIVPLEIQKKKKRAGERRSISWHRQGERRVGGLQSFLAGFFLDLRGDVMLSKPLAETQQRLVWK